MKLVFPVGRDHSTFQTEANYGCVCSCSWGAQNAHDRAVSNSTGCACNCPDYVSVNSGYQGAWGC